MSTCPHAKSYMTPCVLRDGAISYAMNAADEPICVGCERSPDALGLKPPPDWASTVAEYHARTAPKAARAYGAAKPTTRPARLQAPPRAKETKP